MKKKNRFSTLLENLLSLANMKNYVLAKALKYDESYVSKWVSGSLIPSEKNYDRILKDISHCIVGFLDNDTREKFFEEYQLYEVDNLEKAIYENLEEEYLYVKDLKNTTGQEVASKISCYPEMTLGQFVSKMKHPALRRVKELKVYAIIDILNLDSKYQLLIAQLNSDTSDRIKMFPGVQFSMYINMDILIKENTSNAIFLLNMLANLSDIHFRLYEGRPAYGKIIFTVKDAYSQSGMLVDDNYCLAVTTSEDAEISNSMYRRIKEICNKETLLIRQTSIHEMIDNSEYVQSIFSMNLRWLLGHLTEHLLSKELHDELAEQFLGIYTKEERTRIKKVHNMVQKVLAEFPVKILIYESTLNEFAVTGILDFYGRKIVLTVEQRLRYAEHILKILNSNSNCSFKMIEKDPSKEYTNVKSPTFFMSDGFSYLRLSKNSNLYNICVPNKKSISDIFRNFFDDMWKKEEVETTEGEIKINQMEVKSYVENAIRTLNIMGEMDFRE